MQKSGEPGKEKGIVCEVIKICVKESRSECSPVLVLLKNEITICRKSSLVETKTKQKYGKTYTSNECAVG
jgi:hypothetical protein